MGVLFDRRADAIIEYLTSYVSRFNFEQYTVSFYKKVDQFVLDLLYYRLVFLDYFRRWLASTNHMDIGRLYLVMGLWSATRGADIRFIMRVELRRPGQLLQDGQLYNAVVTTHAFLIIFFFVMPTLMGGFGNWFIPLMLTGPDMVFPRLNNFRF